jgi:imidazolonepropionase
MRTLFENIGQLLTMDTTLHDLRSPVASRVLGLVDEAALLIDGGLVRWLGPADELPAAVASGARKVDVGGRVIMPGLVECHTHLLFGGHRAHEFALRAAGASYEEIGRAGGGIANTVAATRRAPADELLQSGMKRLSGFARMGVTTVEIKSGYGLDVETELKMLEVARLLQQNHPLDVLSTFLGAHIVPPEHQGNRETYIDQLCNKLIPEVARQSLAEFCDVFVEDGAFTVAEARRILNVAKSAGMALKVHAEQLTHTGATQLAAELGAVSADHLDHANDADAEALTQSGTVAVLLPGATFFLGKSRYPSGQQFIQAGATVALSTDYNPGSSHTQNLWLMGTLACTHCGLSPAQALWAMTRGAATAINRERTKGHLRPDVKADFLVLEATDWEDILYLYGHNPVAETYKAGVLL